MPQERIDPVTTADGDLCTPCATQGSNPRLAAPRLAAPRQVCYSHAGALPWTPNPNANPWNRPLPIDDLAMIFAPVPEEGLGLGSGLDPNPNPNRRLSPNPNPNPNPNSNPNQVPEEDTPNDPDLCGAP